ncbi:MAG: hypothetical protein HKN28_18980 [Alphaproteobacteria bacterium]|nr:hypothetical protein [Alphaproteobacteria bacterium]
MSEDPKNNGTYQLITPPNSLKARVGAGFGVDTELAKRADSAVQNMQGDFLQRVSSAACEIAVQLSLVEQSDAECAESCLELSRIAQELETQGTAFGFPLVSDVCVSLKRYVENLDAPGDVDSKIIRAHMDVLRSVTGNSIAGDGGQVGNDLVGSLNELVARAAG